MIVKMPNIYQLVTMNLVVVFVYIIIKLSNYIILTLWSFVLLFVHCFSMHEHMLLQNFDLVFTLPDLLLFSYLLLPFLAITLSHC